MGQERYIRCEMNIIPKPNQISIKRHFALLYRTVVSYRSINVLFPDIFRSGLAPANREQSECLP